MVDNTEKLLTAEEGAEITGLHPTTLRKLAWQRRIRSYKVLGALRFKAEDLEELIVERKALTEAS
jgi:excisionase family DNA binding protein